MNDKKPSEIAIEIADLVKKVGTSKAAAKAYGVSSATVSRYLKLLSLPKEELDLIDSGLKPIRARRKTKKASVNVNERIHHCVDILGRVLYANIEQLKIYQDVSETTSRSVIEECITRGLVNKNIEYVPHIFSLTNKGCELANVQKPKHFMSGASIHQRLLRNNIELQMREKNETVNFLNRPFCWNMGLFPSIGEHCVKYTYNQKSEIALVIIDDYYMKSSRILHALKRSHDKEKKVVKGDIILRWQDVIHDFIVYTTSKKQLENHKKFYFKNKSAFKKEPVFRHIESLWEVS